MFWRRDLIPEDARSFVQALHGALTPEDDGAVAFLLRNEITERLHSFMTPPLSLPRRLCHLSGQWHVWRSVCTYRQRRVASDALVVPAVWCDLDPPKALKGKRLGQWQKATYRCLDEFSPAPSLVVVSGRGLHGYWLLHPVVRLEGAERGRLASMVRAINGRLEDALGGDHVGDLGRVMRLPGTVNPKNGALCWMVYEDGPRYSLMELADRLHVDADTASAVGAPRRWPDEAFQATATGKAEKRGRGRPRKAVTVRHLRTLPPWARHLVVGGAWRYAKRYRQPGDRVPDRSRADMAAVGAMVRASWPDERIFAAFQREDWLIGARYRELWVREGSMRAEEYLMRTISRAVETD